MIERFRGQFEQRRDLMAIGFLLLVVVMAVPCDAAGGPEWVIYSSMVPGVGMPRGGGVSGLVAFGMDGADTDTILTAADVFGLTRSGWRSTRMGNWQVRWRPPGYEPFLLSAPGYRPIRLDSLRLPPDSLVVVTATMQPGSDTMSQEVASECCLSVKYKSLDGLLPQNTIVGTVTDDSLDMPVEGVEIYVEENRQRTVTDSLGGFVLALDTLKLVNLHVWHPLYDSIRFEVKKRYLHTEKPIQVHFESQREFPPNRLRYTDSSALLIAKWTGWGSIIIPREFKDEVLVYAVKPGEVFGPTSSWVLGDCLPFRLVRTFTDRRAWVQFVRDLGPRGEKYAGPVNFIDVTDSSTDLSTHTVDGGSTVTLQLQPDYTPNRSVFQDWRKRWTAAERRHVPDRTECDSIRAEVERIHLQNLIYMLTRDFVNLTAAFSKDFNTSLDPFVPSVEYFERTMTTARQTRVMYHRIAALFDLRRAEAYVHGVCDEPVSDRYLNVMAGAGLEPAVGDVLIVFKEAPRSPWHGGWGAVYRKEDGLWKILTSD